MLIRVDTKSNTPVFQQIVDEIKSAVARGACGAGDIVPSVRQLASLALVNPNTVARAYRELEREGILYTRKGVGVFVSDKAAQLCRNGRREDVTEMLKDIVAEAQRAGISVDELKSVFNRALSKVQPPAKKEEKAKR